MHEQYMHRCLQLAQQAKGHTTPNPMVGAVLVYRDQIIGEGWHHNYGGAHAEVNCFDHVNDADKHLIPESTLYVSLEPCAHYGLTPPCAERVVSEGIKQVVICNKDPFAKVDGKGIAILEAAGVQVTTGVLEQAGLWVNRRFFCAYTHKRPYIILKWAQSEDGFIGTVDRMSVQISGPESMQLSHQWRAEEGAIMVGHRTAMNDNPKLTARLYDGKQPLRIAVDRNLSLPRTHHLFNMDAATWIINEKLETMEGNVHFIKLPFGNELLSSLMQRLYEAKILSLIVEGGAALLNGYIHAGLWDEARVFTANNMLLQQGVKTASLSHHTLAFTTESGGDTLSVYTNEYSPYKYVQGMGL